MNEYAIFTSMQIVIDYFENIPSLHRAMLIISGISLLWIIEGIIPLKLKTYHKWKHAFPNFFFILTTVAVNVSLAFLLLLSSDWTQRTGFGIISMLNDFPLWLHILVGVMFLDLIGAYLAHWVEHKIKPLWMIHVVHHSDHFVDATTANRHHPLESIVRFVFTLLGVLVVGAPIGIVMLYQSLSVIFSQFNHANIRLPKKVDQLLSWVIVSPNMHKVHHHYLLPFTDTNYGNIFAIWDRIFTTYAYLAPEKIIYGLDTFPDVQENHSITGMLKQPFQRYRKPTTDKVGNSS